IGFFGKTYTYAVPVTTAGLPVILYLLIILYQSRAQGLTNSFELPIFSPKAVYFTLLAIVAQGFAIFMSSTRYATSKQNAGLIHGFLDVVLVVFTIVLSWYVVQMTVNSQHDIETFMKSTIISLIVFSVLVLLPQIIAAMTPYLHGWVNFLAGLFEKHWFKRGDWYWMGSYAVTMHRVNGFEAEAGYLAAQLGCVFLPPIIAAIANHFDFLKSETRSFHWLYPTLLVWLFIVLALAKTTTGFLVILLAVIALFWKSDLSHKVVYYFAFLGLGLLIVLAYFGTSFVRDLLNQYLFQKGGTDNRLGGTIGLVLAFLHHPIIGVGNNWTGSYLMQFVPHVTRDNPEYYFVYRKESYPILSNWGGWLAQYGLIIVGPVLYYIVKRLKRAYNLKTELRQSDLKDRQLYITLLDAFDIAVMIYAVLAVLVFSWSDYYMLIMFFFYISVIAIATKALDKDKEVA
ncbi:MAG TPA: hypothetical protein DCW31_01690, partial [Lactobacillus sp.]|nr:hypothetical protein [Lactobacillus sp.]